MKLAPFALATFSGKFIQYTVCSLATIWLGPKIIHGVAHAFHRHANILFGLLGVALVVIAIIVLRRIFDRRKGVALPVEEQGIDTRG
jgi:membrane protein DedA with SNARE-associated domain